MFSKTHAAVGLAAAGWLTSLAPAHAAAPDTDTDGRQSSEHEVYAVAQSGETLIVAGERSGPDGQRQTWAQRSLDGGKTWLPGLNPSQENHSIVALSWSEGALFALSQWSVEGPGELILLRSDDFGASWNVVAEVARPSPFATVAAMQWTSPDHGTLALTWDNGDEDGHRCLEDNYVTRDGGTTWLPEGPPGPCGPPRAVGCPAPDSGQWSMARCGEALERAPLVRTLGRAKESLTVKPVSADTTYVHLAAGSLVAERASGARLRLKHGVQGRLDQLPDGRLVATVGEHGGIAACEVAAPTFTVQLVVERDDLATVTTAPVKVEHADGSWVALPAGAPVRVGPSGAASYRFAAGSLADDGVTLPLGAVTALGDRAVIGGPARLDPWADDLAAEQWAIVADWGSSTLLGGPMDAWEPATGTFRRASALNDARVDAARGRAYLTDGCGVAAVATGAGFVAEPGLLGALFDDSAASWIEVGTAVSSLDGTGLGATSSGQPEPGGGRGLGMELGGASARAPEISTKADGRRCGALAAGWAEQADGAPWVLCWAPPRDETTPP